MDFYTMWNNLLKGKAITHENWEKDEYFYYNDSEVYDENDVKVKICDFLAWLGCLDEKGGPNNGWVVYETQRPMPKVGEVYRGLGDNYLVKFADDKGFVLLNEKTSCSYYLTQEEWNKPTGWVKVE